MLVAEMIGVLNELEEKFSVGEWEIGGVHFWPLLRVQLFYRLFSATFSGGVPRKSVLQQKLSKPLELANGLLKTAYSSLSDNRRNATIASEYDVVFLSNGVSYLSINGLWYDKFCDPFIECFRKANLSSLVLCPYYQYLTPRYFPSYLIQPRLDGLKLKNKLFPQEQLYEDSLPSEFKQLAKFFEINQLPVAPLSFVEILDQVGLLRLSANFFKQILRTTKPALAFSVSYYALEGMAFNLACRELGIPSVDIQHGLQGEFHVAYGRWHHVPAQGYELLPTFFWCWSQQEAIAIQQWNQAVESWHRPLVGGDLLLQLWQEEKSSELQQYKNRVAAICQTVSSSAMNILYTLNGLETPEKLIPMLELMQTFDASAFWWIRLHPCALQQRPMLEALLQRYAIRNCELKLATELPLFILLERIQLHITELSSTVIEATKFGVPSVIMHPSGEALFPTEIASGWAVTAYTREEIVAQLKSQFARKATLPGSRNLQLADNQALRTLIEMVQHSQS